MNVNITELLVAVIPIVITVILGWISPYVVKFLDSKIGHNNVIALENFARIAVTAAEQTIKSGSKSDKKDLALAALSAFAADHKYTISEENLNALIEAAVYQLKQWGTPITLTGNETTVPAVPVVNVPVVPAGPEAAASPETVPVTGEEAVPVAEAPDPVKDEVDPAQDPNLSHQTSVNWS
jgi:LL-H family phage holin